MSKKQNEKDDIDTRFEKIPESTGYFRKLFSINDSQEAKNMALEYCHMQTTRVIGDEVIALNANIKESKEKCKQLKDAIIKQRNLLKNTNRTVTQNAKRVEECPDERKRDIRKYLDYFLATGCFLCGLVSISASVMAMYTLVLSAGIIAIIENPNLAWPFCVPLGLGAVALEFFKRTLKTNRAKYCYAVTIYGVCAALMAVWIVLAAKEFGSAANQGFDPNALLNPSDDANQTSIYSIVQLFLEFFIGCTLFTTASDLIAKHSLTREIENEDFLYYQAELTKMEADYKIHHDLLIEQEARLRKIENAVGLYTNEQMLNFQRIRAQMMD